MTEILSREIIEETKLLLGAVRGSLIRVAMNLAQLRGSFAAKGEWGSFCEGELGISESFASKLLRVHNTFLAEGKLEPARLEGIDYEKLYLASGLEGTVEEKLAKAETLSRRELKEEKNEEVPHEHEPIQICRVCSIRL